MEVKNFSTLVNDLKNKATLEKLGPEIALIEPGHWDYFISWASTHGYSCTVDGITEYFKDKDQDSLLESQQNGYLQTWMNALKDLK